MYILHPLEQVWTICQLIVILNFTCIKKGRIIMSENCSHDCGSCSADCSSRSPQNMIEQPNKESRIDKVIGVVSGKGGVGKSMISSMLAVNLQRKGHHTAIMDADVTGPSIPKAFGITEHAIGTASRPCLSISCWRTPTTRSSGEDLSLLVL